VIASHGGSPPLPVHHPLSLAVLGPPGHGLPTASIGLTHPARRMISLIDVLMGCIEQA
jgi:hypothetical protein